MTERAGWTGIIVGILIGMSLTMILARGVLPEANAGGGVHRDVVQVIGPSLCNEDERLVPVRHHNYGAERPSGWVYTCRPFDAPGKMAP